MTETIENLRDFNYYQLSKAVNNTIVLAEYIWIDGTGESLRSKTKVYQTPIKTLEDLEWWTYDGSSTDQAVTRFSEIYLKPVRVIKDPFRGDPHILVLCETYLPDKKTPARYNFRWIANQIMEKAKDHKPWFGIEQEYFLLKRTGTTHLWPLGWPTGGFPYPQGRYYCSIGERNNFGRALAEAHLRACLNAGIKIAGLNAEVAPSQWEFQIGIAEGIEIGDHMWLARYILERIGEEFGIDINYDPKPILGDWNGSGAHCNYSTLTTRSEGGYRYIVDKLMPILKENHLEMIKLYGQKNELRLTGRHETGKYDQFSWGDGSRGCSVRVPIITKEQGQGYFEDRRPAANIDPYLVSAALVDVTCLNGEHLKQLNQIFEDSLKPLGQQIFQQQKEQFQQQTQ
ncbi:unnamed protein product [Paramecium octaurelia]|uniref:glutamine synthetase n=1 Tax=Paramecium octaurelia TaxID=43137 RepID=A0A8S1TI29_PAROT|nr:unnamed protein product [Paramecium octaurelia]